MPAIKKILFPVDLSDVSPEIAPWVEDFADKFSADVHLLFVARVMTHYGGLYVPHPSIQQFEADLAKGGERKLKEFADTAFPDRPVKTKTRPGEPAEEILKYAADEKTDLIIMGTHGRKGLERIFFGSTAERVVKLSPVPVLTVNPYRMSITLP